MERILIASYRTVIIAAVAGFLVFEDLRTPRWYGAVAAICVGTAVGAVALQRPQRIGAWGCLIAGFATFLIGDLLRNGVAPLLTSPTDASWVDGLYLIAYPLVAIGLWLLARRETTDDVGHVFDSIILGLGVFAVAWEASLAGRLSETSLSSAQQGFGFAFAAADVIVIAIAIRSLTRLPRRHPGTIALAASIAFLCVPSLYSALRLGFYSFDADTTVAALWLMAYGALAISLTSRQIGRVEPGPPRPRPGYSRVRYIVVLAAILFIPLLDVIVGARPGQRVSHAIVVLVICLVVGRLTWLLNSFERTQHSLRVEATHDRLTAMLNRSAFAEQLGEGFDERHDARIVMVINLSEFKSINDTMGHLVGDKVLIEVAQRLRGAYPDGIVARFGGDEFAATFCVPGSLGEPDHVARQWCTERARAVLDAIAEPYRIDGVELTIGATLGAVVSTNKPGDPEVLLRSADIALYQAKRRGPGTFEIFEESHYAKRIDEIQLRSDLQYSIERGELRLMYQPIVDVAENRVRSVEALIRWDHPTRGLVSPLEFIPLAEASGYIVEIGQWALETAVSQLQVWQAHLQGAQRLAVAVNVSARQLESDLVGYVDRVLSRHRIRPDDLLLEVTESVPVLGGDEALAVLRRLRELGVRLGVDDFGTGYSSLSFLHHFSVDVIKIDRSLVCDLETSDRANAIVTTVRELTDAVDAVNVAEGVETVEQMNLLIEHGCQLLQGYYFSPPLTPDAFVEFHTEFERNRRLAGARGARTQIRSAK